MSRSIQPSKTKIRLIGVASGLGARDPGCGKGPWAVKHSHWMERLASTVEWSDLIYPKDGLDRWATFADLSTRVRDEVADALVAGEFPVVLGGDHSCAIGTWSGVARGLAALGRGQAFGLLWIDAHMDSHVPSTSLSHAVHGMPIATLLGLGAHEFRPVLGGQAVLHPDSLCLLGIRGFEDDEAALLRRLGTRVIFQDEIRVRGPRACMAEALARVGRAPAGFGVSVDLDAIDPSEAPGVGSPEPAGLGAGELLATLADVFAAPNLLALEIAEYNPEHDRDQRTLRVLVDLLELLSRQRA
jgi:arginase